MNRQPTWSPIGQTFIKGETQLINGVPAPMIFNVEKRPMGFITDNGSFKRVDGTSTVVDEFGNAYGPVSDNYGIVNNEEALSFLEFIEGFEYEKFGALKNGMQFVIGKLPDIKVLGDIFTPHLVFRNSFNGMCPLQMAIAMLRIVCQNQLNWAFKHASNKIMLKHSSKISLRLEEAQRLMVSTNDYLKELNVQAEKYANIKLTNDNINTIINDLFPIKEEMTDRQKEAIEDNISQFRRALIQDDLANFKNTGWGLIQSYADYMTHYEAKRKTDTMNENRFMAVTFDPKAMSLLVDLINARALV